MAGSKKKKGERLRGSHVTGGFAGVALKDFKGPDKHNIRSRSTDLAKLNPLCHMNYLDYLVLPTIKL